MLTFKQFLELKEASKVEKDYHNLKVIFDVLSDFVKKVSDIQQLKFSFEKNKELVISKAREIKRFAKEEIEKRFNGHITDFIDVLKHYGAKDLAMSDDFIDGKIAMSNYKYVFGR